mmetsp:Transcript_18811/g.36883  ORF Transcript_18811/g.36883 Transcript_18811/m.36883 type:complete len:1026 (+) Transcript_18811:119-3196(+)
MSLESAATAAMEVDNEPKQAQDSAESSTTEANTALVGVQDTGARDVEKDLNKSTAQCDKSTGEDGEDVSGNDDDEDDDDDNSSDSNSDDFDSDSDSDDLDSDSDSGSDSEDECYEVMLKGLTDEQKKLVRQRHKELKAEYDAFMEKQAEDRVADIVQATGLTPLEARIAVECCNGDEIEACSRISTEFEFLDTVQEIARAEWAAQERAEEKRRKQSKRERRKKEILEKSEARERKREEREKTKEEKERKREKTKEEKERKREERERKKMERKAKRAKEAMERAQARAQAANAPREKVQIEILDDSCSLPTKRVGGSKKNTAHSSTGRRSEYRKGYRLDGEKRATNLRLGDALKMLEEIKRRKLQKQQAASSTSNGSDGDEDEAGTGSANALGSPEANQENTEYGNNAEQVIDLVAEADKDANVDAAPQNVNTAKEQPQEQSSQEVTEEVKPVVDVDVDMEDASADAGKTAEVTPVQNEESRSSSPNAQSVSSSSYMEPGEAQSSSESNNNGNLTAASASHNDSERSEHELQVNVSTDVMPAPETVQHESENTSGLENTSSTKGEAEESDVAQGTKKDAASMNTSDGNEEEIEYTEEDLRALQWSEARIKAFLNRKSNPNAYYYRFNRLGEKQETGEWSLENQKRFMELIKDGVDYRWGILSMKIPGRVGYQCSNFYRKLVSMGKVIDPNYQIDEQGKLKFVRPKGLKRATAANTKVLKEPKETKSAKTSKKASATAADEEFSPSSVQPDAETDLQSGTAPTESTTEESATSDGVNGDVALAEAGEAGATSSTTPANGEDTVSADVSASASSNAESASKTNTKAGSKSKSKAATSALKPTMQLKRAQKTKEALTEKVAKERAALLGAQRERATKSKKRAARSRAKRKGKNTDEIFADEVDSSDGDADYGTYGYGGAAHKRRRTAASNAGQTKRVESDFPQLIPGLKCPMTYEPVYDPALSPYGHVMGYDTWLRVLGREPRNTCPFTKQKLTRRSLIKLTTDNIDEYRDKIQQVDTNLNFGPTTSSS